MVDFVFKKLGMPMSKISGAVKNGVASESTSETQMNPLTDDLENGLGTMSGSGLSASSAVKCVLTEGHKKAKEGVDTAQKKILGFVDEATDGRSPEEEGEEEGSGQSKVKVKEPDKVRY